MRGLGHVEGLPIIAVLAVLVAIFMVAAPQVFLHWPIYRSFLTTVPPVLLLSLGLTLVIAAGEIDLSFPSVIAFSGYLMAMCLKDWELPWLAVPLALLGGALVGWTNGVLVAIVGVPAIIATLPRSSSGAGSRPGSRAASPTRSGPPTSTRSGTSSSATSAACRSRPSGRCAVAVVLWFVLNRHRFGEHLLFIGDNERVARVVGIQVEREKIKLFTLMGIFGGLAACLLTLENKNFFNTQGQGYLLTALAAVFIGGTSIFGGQGTIVGSVFGAFIITMIEAGLVATGIQGFWVRAVEGVVFLGAVIFHLVVEDRAAGSGGVAALRPAAPVVLGNRGSGREGMTLTRTLLAGVAAGVLAAGAAQAQSTKGPLGDGVTMYMQMGGNPGDGATWARQTGAADAAKAFGVKLIEQFSAWQPEKMLDQFREALAAKPTCIGIMGHPGNGAFEDLVKRRRPGSSSPTATRR